MSKEFKQEVSEPVARLTEQGGDLKEDVRRVVLSALVDYKVDPNALRDIMQATVAGLGQGYAAHAELATSSLKTAMAGLDEAMSKSLYAMRLALEESWQKGKRFSEEDLRTAYDAVKGLENDMVATVKSVTEKSQGLVREEFSRMSEHMMRNGTDTSAQAREVMSLLSQQLSDATSAAVKDAQADAQAASQRLGAVTSGVLRGLADSIDQRTG